MQKKAIRNNQVKLLTSVGKPSRPGYISERRRALPTRAGAAADPPQGGCSYYTILGLMIIYGKFYAWRKRYPSPAGVLLILNFISIKSRVNNATASPAPFSPEGLRISLLCEFILHLVAQTSKSVDRRRHKRTVRLSAFALSLHHTFYCLCSSEYGFQPGCFTHILYLGDFPAYNMARLRERRRRPSRSCAEYHERTSRSASLTILMKISIHRLRAIKKMQRQWNHSLQPPSGRAAAGAEANLTRFAGLRASEPRVALKRLNKRRLMVASDNVEAGGLEACARESFCCCRLEDGEWARA